MHSNGEYHTQAILDSVHQSNLIQDGRIIGAVTHVMVNDPAMGYGIMVETMLDTCGAVREAA